MNNEELIRWACAHSSIKEKELRELLPKIEVYCASIFVSVPEYVEALMRLSNAVIIAANADKFLRKYCDHIGNIHEDNK